MASCLYIDCTNCDFGLEAWSDGNPYYLDPAKLLTKPRHRCKVYVYHPSWPEHPIEGHDVPHVCPACGHEFKVDTEKPRTTCTKCRSSDIVNTYGADGSLCPICKQGRLKAENSGIISSSTPRACCACKARERAKRIVNRRERAPTVANATTGSYARKSF